MLSAQQVVLKHGFASSSKTYPFYIFLLFLIHFESYTLYNENKIQIVCKWKDLDELLDFLCSTNINI